MQDSKRGIAIWHIIVIALATAIIGVAVTVEVMRNQEKDEPTLSSVPAESDVAVDGCSADEKAEMQLRASEVTLTYSNNTIDGDLKFKGKTMYLVGEVANIKAYDDDMIVEFKNNWVYWEVDCYLKQSERKAAAKLSKSSWVVIKGRCIGTHHDSGVKFVDCTIVAHHSLQDRLFDFNDEDNNDTISGWSKSIPELKPFLNK